ncbi:MAG: hypothetical protein K0U38_07435 [Epsilonproteobacteria bacterium]|nr:hypothetical protein [Campylobacterota bacterium]
MIKTIKTVGILTLSALFVGCVPAQGPKPSIHTPTIGSPVQTVQYGYPPQNYRTIIKNYFSNKLKRANMASYTFSKPQRAYKRNGLAYGGDISWKGWLVDVSVITQSRTGRPLKPKPYMVLFSDSVIVEDILGSKHKLITRVGK